MNELNLESTLSHVYDSIRLSVKADTLGYDVVPSFIDSGFEGSILPIPRISYDVLQGWELAVLAVVLLFVVLNKQLYPRQFRQILQVPAGVSQTNQLLREWSPVNSFLGITFVVMYVISVALFIQKSCVILSRDAVQYNSFRVFDSVLGWTIAWVVARYVVLYLFNWLFKAKDTVDRQVTVQLCASTVCMIALQPVLWILLYNPYSAFVWVGVGVLALGMLLRFYLQIKETRVSSKAPVFYIFLYFCTLEIVPGALLLTAGLRFFSHGSVF